MTELIEKVKAAKAVLNNSQKELLNWCQDKSAAPLKDRFEVWRKYVDKNEHPYIGVGEGSKLLAELVDAWTDNRDIDRRQTVSWDWVLEGICDMFDSKYNESGHKRILKVLSNHTQLLRDKRIESILSDSPDAGSIPALNNLTCDEFEDIVREEIMACNFGSFEYDW